MEENMSEAHRSEGYSTTGCSPSFQHHLMFNCVNPSKIIHRKINYYNYKIILNEMFCVKRNYLISNRN